MLDSLLKHGGFLSIFNSNYRFTDTKIASGYSIVSYATIKERVPKFDKFNKLIFKANTCIEPFLYQKS